MELILMGSQELEAYQVHIHIRTEEQKQLESKIIDLSTCINKYFEIVLFL